jgi:hypothetical protein
MVVPPASFRVTISFDPFSETPCEVWKESEGRDTKGAEGHPTSLAYMC